MSSLNNVVTSLDSNNDVEATRPHVNRNALRRSSSVLVEYANDRGDEDVDSVLLEEKKEEGEEPLPPLAIDTPRKEFLHLQAGLMNSWYQHEAHTASLLAKLEELATKFEECDKKNNERFLKLEAAILVASDNVWVLDDKIKSLLKSKNRNH